MKVKYLLTLIIVIGFSSCKEKKEESSIFDIGEYLYQDKGGVIHVWDHCIKLWGGEDNNHGVKRIPSNGFDPRLLNNTCSFCIKDKVYNKLKENIRSTEDWSQYEVEDSQGHIYCPHCGKPISIKIE